MASPKLSVRSSGFGGRGYAPIFDPEATEPLPSITTALGVLDKGGVTQWAVDQTVDFVLAHLDKLYGMSDTSARGYLRFYHSRKEDFDSPDFDPYSHHSGVLHDAADTGTTMHEYIEARFAGVDDPYLPEGRYDLFEMAEQFELWLIDNDVEVHAIETTVYGDGYAGTADWFGTVNGKPFVVDNKTSRGIRDSHLAQLAAIGAAHTLAREVDFNTPGAVSHKIQPSIAEEHGLDSPNSWWVPEPLPSFSGYAILHMRPTTEDGPAHCTFEEIPQAKIDAAWGMFKGALMARHAEKKLKQLTGR